MEQKIEQQNYAMGVIETPQPYEMIFEAFKRQKKEWKEFKCDKMIQSLVNYLNMNDHMVTMYSCEGHDAGEKNFYGEICMVPNTPYLFFNVDKIGSEIFWNKCIREILIRTANYAHIEVWSNKISTPGIVLRCYDIRKKQLFWDVVTDVLVREF